MAITKVIVLSLGRSALSLRSRVSDFCLWQSLKFKNVNNNNCIPPKAKQIAAIVINNYNNIVNGDGKYKNTIETQ